MLSHQDTHVDTHTLHCSTLLQGQWKMYSGIVSEPGLSQQIAESLQAELWEGPLVMWLYPGVLEETAVGVGRVVVALCRCDFHYKPEEPRCCVKVQPQWECYTMVGTLQVGPPSRVPITCLNRLFSAVHCHLFFFSYVNVCRSWNLSVWHDCRCGIRSWEA